MNISIVLVVVLGSGYIDGRRYDIWDVKCELLTVFQWIKEEIWDNIWV